MVSLYLPMACAWHSSSHPNDIGLRVSISQDFQEGLEVEREKIFNGYNGKSTARARHAPGHWAQQLRRHKALQKFPYHLETYVVSTQGFLYGLCWSLISIYIHREKELFSGSCCTFLSFRCKTKHVACT